MKKILLIEDEKILRDTIQELLQITGFSVSSAANGTQGLAQVQRNVPDLILCDVMMPVLDGYGFLKAHMASPHKNIPVLLLTAKIETKDQCIGVNLGAKAYVLKPFVLKELLSAMQPLL